MNEKGYEKNQSEFSEDGRNEITNFSPTVYDRPVSAENITGFAIRVTEEHYSKLQN
jgi:hypothetical protein